MAVPISKLYVLLGLKDELSGGLDKTKGNLSSWGKSLTDAGQKLSLGVTAPLVAGGVAAIKWASDLNEATSAVNTVFGDSADQILGDQGSVAKSLGLTREQALTTASELGALYKSIGITGDTAAGMSNQVVKAAADLGSFFNTPIDQVLADIQSGLVGESEPLRKYGILLSEAAVQQRAMADTGKTSTKELTEQEKVMARQELIMEQLGAAQGDFQRTSRGLANSTRIATAQLKDAAAMLGQQLLPYALKAVQGLSGLITAFNGLSPSMQKVILIVAGVAAVIGPLLVVVGTMASGIAAVGAVVGAVIPVLGALGAVLGLLLSPVGLIVVAVAGLYLAWHYNLFGVRDITGEVVDWLVEKFGQLVGWFTGGGLDAALETLRRWALDLIHYGRIALKYYVGWPYYLGRALYEPVKEKLGELASLFAELPGKITAPFADMFNLFFNIGYNIISGLIAGIAALWDEFVGWVEGIVSKVGEVADRLHIHSPSRVTMAWGEEIVRGMAMGIEGAMPMLDRAVGGMAGSITGEASRRVGGSGRTLNFASGAIVVNGASDAEATAKAILRAIRYQEAGAA